MSLDHLRRFPVVIRRSFYCVGILADSASMRGVEVKHVPRDFAFSGARHSPQKEAETEEIGEVASATSVE